MLGAADVGISKTQAFSSKRTNCIGRNRQRSRQLKYIAKAAAGVSSGSPNPAPSRESIREAFLEEVVSVLYLCCLSKGGRNANYLNMQCLSERYSRIYCLITLSFIQYGTKKHISGTRGRNEKKKTK